MKSNRPLTLEISKAYVAINSSVILHDISLKIGGAEFVTIIGSNGAGKSTLLRTISGFYKLKSGNISFYGKDISKLEPENIVKMGLSHVPERRHVFAALSVRDNLELGSYLYQKVRSQAYQHNIRFVYNLFPVLEERKRQSAGTLSGGEQQMLAVGRALMAEPKLLMLDEPSLGLAPIAVEAVFRVLADLNRERLPILLIEQNAKISLDVAETGYILERGRVRLQGKTRDLLGNRMVVDSYLGKQVVNPKGSKGAL
ncbi:MAG: ABC transporter ATP-binding protein [Deltaproteobacteria bacterium]|nr:ABC transporter ATP-binding protein [Deltaproteobacteria bacterium]MBW2333519.1 ABC transporter ATP-binding protein [Deltaproteobacteria bacterium]